MNGEKLISENIKSVWARIANAAEKSGRNLTDIKLVAVTKTVGIERIREAFEAGLSDIGENRVQEMLSKYDGLGEDANWHLIGHLQTNKVKYIIGKTNLIHSLDRMELAEEIQKRAEKAGIIVDCLVQVNIAEEDSKFGLHKDDVLPFIRKVSEFANIRIKGLMTIAPFFQNPEDSRWVFKELAKLRIDINRENIDNIYMDYLSMGMSNDFEIAIEEGSNMVRIGTAIFGSR